jgi:hypothetical protein
MNVLVNDFAISSGADESLIHQCHQVGRYRAEAAKAVPHTGGMARR